MKRIIPVSLAFLIAASGALAHSKAEKTKPANEATVQALEVIEMRFDDPMRVTMFTVTGPQGVVEIERETGMEAVTVFRALPPDVIPAGSYTVDWRGLAADGHPMQGTFGFTVAD